MRCFSPSFWLQLKPNFDLRNEEMKTLAARTFQLPTHGIVLMTSSVDVCRGGEVMLGGDTWEWVKGVVSEMRVSMRDGMSLALHDYP